MHLQETGNHRCPLCRAELEATQVFGITDLAPRKPAVPRSKAARSDDDDSSLDGDEAAAPAPMDTTDDLFAGISDVESSTKFDAVVQQLQDCRRCSIT